MLDTKRGVVVAGGGLGSDGSETEEGKGFEGVAAVAGFAAVAGAATGSGRGLDSGGLDDCEIPDFGGAEGADWGWGCDGGAAARRATEEGVAWLVLEGDDLLLDPLDPVGFAVVFSGSGVAIGAASRAAAAVVVVVVVVSGGAGAVGDALAGAAVVAAAVVAVGAALSRAPARVAMKEATLVLVLAALARAVAAGAGDACAWAIGAAWAGCGAADAMRVSRGG
ncbi:MAG TPA: hypothetical protein VMA86_03780 [Acetobacteraceae bacterium]|nr:hypothetical protein [Acetobacteraceae bacterium]